MRECQNLIFYKTKDAHKYLTSRKKRINDLTIKFVNRTHLNFNTQLMCLK